MKIVITGITSLRNRGVEALVRTVVDQLRDRLPNSKFLVLDQAPEHDAAHFTASDTRFRFDETLRRIYVSRFRSSLMTASRFVKRLAPEYREICAEIESADLLCASGGDIFSSVYGRQSLLAHLEPLRIARAFARPYFLVAHSVGPFQDEGDSAAFCEVAHEAAGISVREGISYRYLTQDLGLSTALVAHTADPAFLLDPPEPGRLEQLRAYYCGGKRPLIAVAPSQAISAWMNVDRGRHFKAWCRLVTMLLRDLEAEILLVPHVQEIAPWNDDRIFVTDLVRQFDFDRRMHVVGGDYSASELKGIIGSCDMLIAERMHASIAGLSSGVCTVTIAYSVKAEGILCDIFDAETIDCGLLLSFDDFLDEEVACAKVQNAWRMKPTVEAVLRGKLPEIRRRAGSGFDLIAAKLPPSA